MEELLKLVAYAEPLRKKYSILHSICKGRMGQSSRELNQTMLAKRIHDTQTPTSAQGLIATAHGEEQDPNKLQSSLLCGMGPSLRPTQPASGQ